MRVKIVKGNAAVKQISTRLVAERLELSCIGNLFHNSRNRCTAGFCRKIGVMQQIVATLKSN